MFPSFKIFSFLFIIAMLNGPIRSNGQLAPIQNGAVDQIMAIELQIKMRSLWSEQVVNLRKVMLCIIDTLPGETQATTVLIQNLDQIGEALLPYFGEENSELLTELLYANSNFSIEVFRAARIDSVIEKAALVRWTENANRFSLNLKKVFVKYASNDLQSIFTDNLNLTFEQLQKHVIGDFDGDQLAYQLAKSNSFRYADLLSKRIIEKFPERFYEAKNKMVSN